MRVTENVVYVNFEGTAAFEVEEPVRQRFETEPFDVVVIPSWAKYRIINRGEEPLILFSYSDEPLFKAIGTYRKEKLPT